jgi:hypothetical protein
MNGLPGFSLAGRRALVTGSVRGLGLEMARGLAGAGAEVIVNGRDPAALGITRGSTRLRPRSTSPTGTPRGRRSPPSERSTSWSTTSATATGAAWTRWRQPTWPACSMFT